jgi:uncharacterized iron-regulated protein
MRNLILLLPAVLAACATPPPFCPLPGQWVAPSSLRSLQDPVLEGATKPVVLLGEQHDSEADHRWQLATITRLYATNPGMVLGFEMFPRAAQPVLDKWVAGRLSEADFLTQSDWARVWGFPPRLYMPIFRFARDHHIPMRALNVSHHLVHLVAQNGWQAVPAAEREGVGAAAPPSEAYRASLQDAMSGHGGPAMTPARLQHFIEAQSVWDRAMAEAIAAERAREPGRLVVALMGAGHVENRFGVPHQLDSLGYADVTVLVPAHHVCTPFGHGYADAVYIN